MNHIFFQNIGNRQQVSISEEEKKYIYNSTILELANNWQNIQELMNKYRNRQISHVTVVEKEWIDFLVSNNINTEKIENCDVFIEKYFKN